MWKDLSAQNTTALGLYKLTEASSVWDIKLRWADHDTSVWTAKLRMCFEGCGTKRLRNHFIGASFS